MELVGLAILREPTSEKAREEGKKPRRLIVALEVV